MRGAVTAAAGTPLPVRLPALRVAAAGGGRYIHATSTDSSLVTLYEQELLPLARPAPSGDERPSRKARFQWPLALAVLLWSLDWCLRGGGAR